MLITGTLIPKGQSANITTTLNLPEKVQAPIEEGQVLGNVTYSFGDETLRKCRFNFCNFCSKIKLW